MEPKGSGQKSEEGVPMLASCPACKQRLTFLIPRLPSGHSGGYGEQPFKCPSCGEERSMLLPAPPLSVSLA